jgi:hypothetical protein
LFSFERSLQYEQWPITSSSSAGISVSPLVSGIAASLAERRQRRGYQSACELGGVAAYAWATAPRSAAASRRNRQLKVLAQLIEQPDISGSLVATAQSEQYFFVPHWQHGVRSAVGAIKSQLGQTIT